MRNIVRLDLVDWLFQPWRGHGERPLRSPGGFPPDLAIARRSERLRPISFRSLSLKACSCRISRLRLRRATQEALNRAEPVCSRDRQILHALTIGCEPLSIGCKCSDTIAFSNIYRCSCLATRTSAKSAARPLASTPARSRNPESDPKKLRNFSERG